MATDMSDNLTANPTARRRTFPSRRDDDDPERQKARQLHRPVNHLRPGMRVSASGVPIRPEVAVRLIAAEHMERDDQDAVPDGDLRPAGAASPAEAGMLRGEIVLAVHPCDGADRLDEHQRQPLVAAPAAGWGALAGGLVDARCHAGPRG